MTLRQQQRGFEMKLESGEATIQVELGHRHHRNHHPFVDNNAQKTNNINLKMKTRTQDVIIVAILCLINNWAFQYCAAFLSWPTLYGKKFGQTERKRNPQI